MTPTEKLLDDMFTSLSGHGLGKNYRALILSDDRTYLVSAQRTLCYLYLRDSGLSFGRIALIFRRHINTVKSAVYKYYANFNKQQLEHAR